MPRRYVKSTRKPYQKHDQAKISEAVEAIKENRMNYRQASRHFGIPVGVLHRHKTAEGGKVRAQGGQPVFLPEEEEELVKRILVCARWGDPLTPFELRLIIKGYLDRIGRNVLKFKNNTPGRDYIYSFLRRHKSHLKYRLCQNIKRSRAAISREILTEYFENLNIELDGVCPANVVNYDETNLTDDPGKKKVMVKRSCKYPERVMNSSKSSTSIMFAAAADGKILPPYVVYKSQHLYTTWTEGGPSGCRYNRTKSGWFDKFCFEDWVITVAIPFFRQRPPGKKILLGDNLTSHLSWDCIGRCLQEDIYFVFLPPNSTHICQPLDVGFFRPAKTCWRSVVEEWKLSPNGRTSTTIPKDVFPRLLSKFMIKIQEKGPGNVISAFRKCGIVPFNPSEVLEQVPAGPMQGEDLDYSFETFLREQRYGQGEGAALRRTRKSRLTVRPGTSVGPEDNPSNNETSGEQVDDPEEEQDGANTLDNTEGSTSDDVSVSSDEDSSNSEEDGPDRVSAVQSYSIGQWVLVRFDGKKTVKYYVGRIIGYGEDGDLNIRFARKFGKNHFKWPPNDDIGEINPTEIQCVLPEPSTTGNKERVSTFYFDTDFQGLQVN